MKITDIVTTEFEECGPDTPLSAVVGRFDDPAVEGLVVRDGDDLAGVLTRRAFTASHRNPDQTAGSLAMHVPRLSRHEDVRETARLLVESGSRLLPVFEGDSLVGVVTATDVLEAVRPNLAVLTVADVASDDLVTVAPDAPLGEVLSAFRTYRVSHLPVVEDGRAVGVASLYDVAAFATRETTRSQGGDAGEGALAAGQAGRGGFGSRSGERGRLLDLPARDVMTTPVLTVPGDTGMDDAVDEMLEAGVSSLVVVSTDGVPTGIVTTTDALDALTWGAEGNRAVQVYGVDLLDDASYDDVVALVDGFDDVLGDAGVLDARVHLHEHTEKHRGTPLVLARIRLDTDRGLFTATGTGYGASHALNEARDVLERRLRDDKTYARSKKHPDDDYWERRFGWWLEG